MVSWYSYSSRRSQYWPILDGLEVVLKSMMLRFESTPWVEIWRVEIWRVEIWRVEIWRVEIWRAGKWRVEW